MPVAVFAGAGAGPRPLSRAATTYTVRLAGYPIQGIQVLSVEQCLGAMQDNALMVWDLGRTQELLDNVSGVRLAGISLSTLSMLDDPPGNLMSQICEIFRVTGGVEVPVHYGRLNLNAAMTGDRGESLILTSRMEKEFFGVPLRFQTHFDVRTDELVEICETCVFNPEINGGTVGNKRVHSGTFPFARPVFIHPLAIMTREAGLYQEALTIAGIIIGGDDTEAASIAWNLPEAVLYLCAECNPSGAPFVNPIQADLEAVLGTDRTIIRNHEIPVGAYLPDALDALLTPYGYTWKITYGPAADARAITVLKMGRGLGTPQPLLLQANNSNLNLDETNLAHIDIRTDTGAVVNQVRAIGNLTQIEATFELTPAWPNSLDLIDDSLYTKSSPVWDTHPENHRVHRDWVLNEDGSYNNFRDDDLGQTDAFDLTPLFREVFGEDHPVVTARRRRFLPTLTTRGGVSASAQTGADSMPIGETGGITVEWYDVDAVGDDDDPFWKTINPGDPFMAIEVLTGECGIRFNGDKPHPKIMNDTVTGDVRLRVTATVTSDTRIEGFAPRLATSLTPTTNETILDVSSSFHARLVVREGSWFSKYADAAQYTAFEADARAPIQQYAERLRDSWDMADMAGTAELEGLDRDGYALGETVSDVTGRGIFMIANGDVTRFRFPQIVRRLEDVQNQRVILTLATTRERPQAIMASVRTTHRRPLQKPRIKMPRTL